MSRTRIIGWTAFLVCILGYSGAALAVFLNRSGQIEMREALLFGGPAAMVGEIGLWIAAASLGWSVFKGRKAMLDKVFRRKTDPV